MEKFKVVLANGLQNQMRLNMCDADNAAAPCQVIDNRGEFPPTPGTVDRVKITPTDASGNMPDYWKIYIKDYYDEFKFEFLSESADALVHEIICSKVGSEPGVKILLKGGTRNWELTIRKPGVPDSKKDWDILQTSNVTIGADWA
jgi:hypothetical protein